MGTQTGHRDVTDIASFLIPDWSPYHTPPSGVRLKHSSSLTLNSLICSSTSRGVQNKAYPAHLLTLPRHPCCSHVLPDITFGPRDHYILYPPFLHFILSISNCPIAGYFKPTPCPSRLTSLRYRFLLALASTTLANQHTTHCY